MLNIENSTANANAKYAENGIVLNVIAINYYIHAARCMQKIPNIHNLKREIKKVQEIERQITRAKASFFLW